MTSYGGIGRHQYQMSAEHAIRPTLSRIHQRAHNVIWNAMYPAVTLAVLECLVQDLRGRTQ